MVTCIRKFEGVWVPRVTAILRSPGLCLAHHTLAPDTQNICAGLRPRPGSSGSSPCCDTQDSEEEVSMIR